MLDHFVAEDDVQATVGVGQPFAIGHLQRSIGHRRLRLDHPLRLDVQSVNVQREVPQCPDVHPHATAIHQDACIVQ